jgi:hypothetical protein
MHICNLSKVYKAAYCNVTLFCQKKKKKKKKICLRPSIVWKGKMGVYLNPHIWIYDTLSQFSIQLWQSRFETSFLIFNFLLALPMKD